MKIINRIFFILSCFIFQNISAQNDSISFSNDTVKVLKGRSSVNPYQFAVAISMGTDIGGAVPVPVSNVPGTVRAYPDINASLGARFTVPVAEYWMLGAEVTYKKLSLDAKTRVENQKFQDKGNDFLQYFTGTAKMNMSFTFLEVPLLVKYNFGSSRHRAIAGPYFSYYLNTNFVTTAKIGFKGREPNKVDEIIDEDFEMVFTPYLDNWNIGAMVGYECEIFNRIQLGVRFAMSFRDIFKSDSRYFDYKMLPMYGSVLVSYDLYRKR